MATLDGGISGMDDPREVGVSPFGVGRPLHRLGIVRRLQGLSRRSLARRLNVDVAAIAEQEEEMADLPLSTLYEWQQALGVPVEELLIDEGASLSPPVLQRARMVRLMKTVLLIRERSNQAGIRNTAQTLADQLIAMMPELKSVTAWNAVGQRRRLNEYGRAADRRFLFDGPPELLG